MSADTDRTDPPTPDPLTPRTMSGIAFAAAISAGPFKPESYEFFAARVAEIENDAAALPSAPDHSCANHDETLDEAYRKGWADGASAPDQRLREAAEAVVCESSFKEDGTPGAYPSIAAIIVLRAALSEATTSPEATLDDVRLDALDHHSGWCSCAARGWLPSVETDR